MIVTTHNPAILDGLNLKDDSQRLFVVRRNDEGHTRAKRIEYKPERKMKLSELWTNGFIGGLPENFWFTIFLNIINMKFALITEGPSEHKIIKHILSKYFKGFDPEINQIQPKIVDGKQDSKLLVVGMKY